MARKLNTPFVVSTLVGLSIVAAAGVIVWKYARPSLNSFIAKGDSAWKSGDYDQAADFYGKAAAKDPTRSDLAILFVDAYDFTVRGNIDRFQSLLKYYSQILQNDPKCVPALERMLDLQQRFYTSDTSDRSRNRTLSDIADRLLALKPEDRKAKLAKLMCVVEPWAREQPVDAEVLDQAIQTCQKMLVDDPKDSQAIQYLTRIRITEAIKLAQQNDPERAETKVLDSIKTLDDVIARAPDNSGAYYGKFLCLQLRAQLQTKRDEQMKIIKQAMDTLATANSKIIPSDESFMSIRMEYLRRMEGINLAEAEAGYRKLIDDLPNDRQGRIYLAELIGRLPGRKEDAIKLLESPWEPKVPLKGLDSINQEYIKRLELTRLCQIKLDVVDSITDSAEKEMKLAEVERMYKDLTSGTADTPSTLRILGGIQVQRGQVFNSINTYEKALKLTNPDAVDRRELIQRMEILYDYALSYLRLNQTGQARPPLEEIITRAPGYLPARFALARLLCIERKFDQAKVHVDALQKVLPDNPAVIKLALVVLGGQKDGMAKQYAALPETTPQQRELKFQTAELIENVDEMNRLSKLMIDSDPGDDKVVKYRVNTLLQLGQKDDAIAVIDRAAKIKPTPDLTTMRAIILSEDGNVDERYAKLIGQIEQSTDEYEREIDKANLSREFGKMPEAMASLKKAQSINPKDGRAPDMLFGIYVQQHQWQDAELLLPVLATANVDQTNGMIRKIQLIAAKASAEPAYSVRNGMIDEAITQASTLATNFPTIADTSLLLGQLYQARAQFDRAVEQYQTTIEHAPTKLDASFGLVQCLTQLGRFDEARRYIEDARRLAPTDGRFRNLQIQWEIANGDPKRAIDPLLSAVATDEGNRGNWMMLGIAYQAEARRCMIRADRPSAVVAMKKAAETFSKVSTKWPDDIRAAAYLSDTYRALGQNDDAEGVFVKMSGMDKLKNSPDVAQALAENYLRSGKVAPAEQLLRDYIARVNPTPTAVVMKLCAILLQQSRIADAITLLESKKEDPECQRQRAELLMGAGRVDEARTLTDEILAKGANPDIYILRGFIELRTGNLDKALSYIESTLKLKPNDPAALFYRAQISMNAVPPKLEDARQDLEKVRDLLPANIEARLSLADLFLRRGQRDEAIREVESAWGTTKSSKAALMKLIDLYSGGSVPAWNNIQTVLAQAREQSQFANDPDVALTEANMWIERGKDNYPKAITIARQIANATTSPEYIARYIEILVRANQPREAIAEVDNRIKDNPGAWWLYRLKGIAYRQLDQRTDAMEAFNNAIVTATSGNNEQAFATVVQSVVSELGGTTAIELLLKRPDPNLPTKLFLATLYKDAGDAPNAMKWADAVLAEGAKLRPDQKVNALRVIAATALQKAEPDAKRAKQAYEDLLAIIPNDIMTINNYAFVLTLPESGATPEMAMQYAKRAYTMLGLERPYPRGSEYVLDTYGWVLICNSDNNPKNFSEGMTILEEVADKNPDFPDVYLHIAEAHLRKSTLDDLDAADTAVIEAKNKLASLAAGKRSTDPALSVRIQLIQKKILEKRKSVTELGPKTNAK